MFAKSYSVKTIICPTNFSPGADNAATYAAALSDELKSRLILIHLFERPVMYTEQPFAAIQLSDEQVRMSCEKKMSEMKSKLKTEHAKLDIEYEITEGVSFEHLVEVMDREKADLVILGASHAAKWERLFMGSLADDVIGKAHCPVLIIPENVKFKGIKKILFSTDLQEDNINAAAAIAPFAKHFNSEIIFLYVNNKHVMHTDEAVLSMTYKIKSHIQYSKISGYTGNDPNIEEGINYFLKKHPADLLVMFTHQRHFPASLFHSGITMRMSHQTKIPLLSLKFADAPVLA